MTFPVIITVRHISHIDGTDQHYDVICLNEQHVSDTVLYAWSVYPSAKIECNKAK